MNTTDKKMSRINVSHESLERMRNALLHKPGLSNEDLNLIRTESGSNLVEYALKLATDEIDFTNEVCAKPAEPKPKEPRAETGAMQINDDWPGVFIRGDNAFGLALDIEQLIKDQYGLNVASLRGYIRVLRSCVQSDPATLQVVTGSVTVPNTHQKRPSLQPVKQPISTVPSETFVIVGKNNEYPGQIAAFYPNTDDPLSGPYWKTPENICSEVLTDFPPDWWIEIPKDIR